MGIGHHNYLAGDVVARETVIARRNNPPAAAAALEAEAILPGNTIHNIAAALPTRIAQRPIDSAGLRVAIPWPFVWRVRVSNSVDRVAICRAIGPEQA